MRSIRAVLLCAALVAMALPSSAAAQTSEPFEISAWIPYWRSEAGVESILPNVGQFTEVNPFFYTVKNDGTLHANGSLTDGEWVRLKREADTRGIDFIPTVMWAGSDAIHATLSNGAARQRHIKSIASEVYRHNLDGIDIDYEAKYARTRPYFSLFLKELADAIGYDRKIMCTIESRTPLDSRYSSIEAIPADIEYANDFSEINKYCDRVRIMAYDQGRIDLKLNDANGDPYVPVADSAWVEKVMRLAAEEIDKDKLLIGVPTYGYEYDMFESLSGSGKIEYSRLWSFNPGYADEVIQTLGVQPTRDAAGELTLTYPATQSLDPAIPLPFATRVLSWSDAESIRQKAALAEALGLRGISIFKVDGGQDPKLWDVLAEYEDSVVAVSDSVASPSTPATPPPTVAVDVPTRNLELGSVGEDVRRLQIFLNGQGFTVSAEGGGSPGNETQYFGEKTRAALARFQAANSVRPAVGYYGPVTRRAITSLD